MAGWLDRAPANCFQSHANRQVQELAAQLRKAGMKPEFPKKSDRSKSPRKGKEKDKGGDKSKKKSR